MRQSLPQSRVAVVQSEKETLHSPQFDLGGLGLEEWGLSVDVLTERDYGDGQHLAAYDAVVFATNAIHQAHQVAASISEHGLPATNCVVLLQNEAKSYNALRLDGIAAVGLPDKETAVFELDPTGSDEPIVNWPHPITDAKGASAPAKYASSIRVGLEAENSAQWEVVAPIRTETTRHAGLVRSPIGSRTQRGEAGNRRIVLSTLPLIAGDVQHRSILINAIVFAALGLPRLVVLTSTDHPRPMVQRKLRLSGAEALSIEIGRDERVSFADWPLLRARRVLLAREIDRERNLMGLDEWLRKGGSLMSVRQGDFVVERGTTDRRRIGLGWARWFQSREPEEWFGGTVHGRPLKGSIFRSRAVLRCLQTVLADPTTDDSFSLPTASSYRELARGLILGRIAEDGSVDGTVSTTCAVIEIDAIVGEVLDGAARERMRAWLRSRFADVHLEERLEIARVLGDGGLFRAAIAEVRARGEVTFALLSRIRLGAADLGIDPNDLEDLEPSGNHPASTLLAAATVLSWARLKKETSWQPGPSDWNELDQALPWLRTPDPATGGRDGVDDVDAEVLSDVAHAKLVLFALDDIPTDLMEQSRAGSDESLLRAASTLRAELSKRDAELERALDEYAQEHHNLRYAANLLSALVVAGMILAVATISVALPDVGTEPAVFPVTGITGILLLALLKRHDLAADWAVGLGKAVSGGLAGIWTWASTSAGSLASRGPRSAASPTEGDLAESD